MKYVKMLGLLALAATALMAFAATASATTLTSPKGTQYTGTLHADTEGHAILHDTSGLGITIECNGTVHGTVTAGGAGVTPIVHLTEVPSPTTGLAWSNCTNNWSVTTLKGGTLEIHLTGTDTGTVTSTGAEVTTKQSTSGLHCIYSTSATDVGTLTSTTHTGGHATLDISATINRTGGSSGILCGSKGTWTGSYTITTPSTGYID